MGREDLARAALARQREAESQRTELAVQLDQLLGEEAKLTIAAQRLQARKARIYWFGLQDEDREDAFGPRRLGGGQGGCEACSVSGGLDLL